MAEQTDAVRADQALPSPGARVAAAVRGVGAGAGDLTENAGRAGAAALAATVRNLTSMWGTMIGMTLDGAIGVALPRRRHRARPNGSPPRRCIDLTDARTGEQIDEALAERLPAAAPRRRTAVME